MTVCIVGNGLTALTLAKSLVNCKIDVEVFTNKKNYKISNSRTIGIAKNNVEFFNKHITNINKIIWKLKKKLICCLILLLKNWQKYLEF